MIDKRELSNMPARKALLYGCYTIIGALCGVVVDLYIAKEKLNDRFEKYVIKSEFDKAQISIDYYNKLIKETYEIRAEQIKRKDIVDSLKQTK